MRKRGHLSQKDWQTFKTLLREQAELLEAKRLKEAQEEAERYREEHLFAEMMQGVQPLTPPNRALAQLPKPKPIPKQRIKDEQAALRKSLSDDYGAEWLIEADETLSFRRKNIGFDVIQNLRKGKWAIQAQLDLHGYRVDGARLVVNDFISQCFIQNIRCIRIIHGKGLGSINKTPVLKEKVRRWLIQKQEVLAFVEAPENDGGSGVLRVLLKAKRISP